MLKIVCPKCKNDDKWEVYEVLNDLEGTTASIACIATKDLSCRRKNL